MAFLGTHKIAFLEYKIYKERVRDTERERENKEIDEERKKES